MFCLKIFKITALTVLLCSSRQFLFIRKKDVIFLQKSVAVLLALLLSVTKLVKRKIPQ